MATSNGSSGDDTIYGSTGADSLNGGAGADYLYGDAGSDRLNGGSGTDTLDGGSGGDTLNGDSGNDTLVYTLAQNAGAGDLYTGGSGIDTVRLMLTNAEWLNDSVQLQLARYFAHLATVQTNNQGEVSNGSSRDFTFNFSSYFGSSTTLTVQMMERLEVYVDGAIVIDLDKPIIDLPDSTVTGGVTEDAAAPDLTTSGSIKFFDLDLSDTHTVAVVADAGNTLGGTLTTITSDSTGDGSGAVGWTYSVANSATQYLAAGETVTETFAVTIADSGGGPAVTQNVIITVTGTNDAPTVSAVGNGTLTEDASAPTLSTTVSVDFNDVDLSDTLDYSVVKSSGTLGGTLAPLSSNDSGAGAAGSVSYTYSVANSATQYLAAGQTATETFTITADDGNGGTVEQLVTVTITGTNDAPTVSAVGNGTLTEDASAPTLSTTVSVDFNDVDLSDTLDYSVVKSSGTLGGTLAPLSSNDSGAGAAGSVSYTYSVANSATQYLAAGETATETFTITADDGNGGTVDQLVTVTITGTNDDPTVSAVGNGTLTEDASAPTLSTTVSVDFNDVDLSDTLDYSVVKSSGTLGGTLAPLSSNDSGAGAAGTVSYTYSVANSATQYLAAGQTATETFTITADDGNGGTVDQLVTVTITGTNDDPTVSAVVDGTLTEDASAPTLSTTVSVDFNDVDLSDTLDYSFVKSSGTLGGTLAPLSSNDSGAGAAGSVSYTYSVANSATQYLAVGQTATETFTITADDGNGGTVDQLVTVTITGTNDDPTVSAVVDGTLTEDASAPTLSTTVSVDFNDVDLSDTLDYSFVKSSGTLGGTLAPLSSNDSGAGAAGSVSYTYSVANSATQYLAAGQTATETFTITADDGNGGTVDQLVTVTITGTNDDPTVSAFVNGTLTEDASAPTLSTTVSVDFNDVDLSDTLDYSFVKSSGTLGGTLTLLSSNDSGAGAAGSVSYTYSVANSATQYLAAGQTATETFTITADDGNGGTVDQLVTVTITGTNDDPTVSAFVNGTLTEDASAPTLSTTVSVDFNDVDLSDTLDYSFVKSSGTLGGTLTLLSSNDSGAGAAGSVSYTYSVANSATQYLAAGQTATETFTITADDGNGGTVDQLVTVTITGTNDDPTVSAFVNGTLTEDASAPTLSTTVSVDFNDVDLSDTLDYSFVKSSGTLGGTLTLLSSNDSGAGAAGSVSYTYSVANSATQYLAAGQTATETFTITADDGNGGTVDQLVTVTITGTNDDPTVSAFVNGTLTEDASAPTLSTTVSVDFNDVDLSDTLDYSVVKSSGTLGGTLTLLSSNDSGAGAAGSVSYTYSVANSATQYLAAGQTATETFTITADDGNGGTVEQLVTVTITGTNDAPVITVGAGDSASASLTESNIGLSATDTLTVTDVDVSDLVTPSVFAVSTTGPTGGLSNATLLAMMGVAPSPVDTTTTTTGQLTWTFNSGSEAFNFLNTTNTLELKYTIRATDDSLAIDDQFVTITITGTNDAAVITGTSSGSVTEATSGNPGIPSATGDLLATDVDNTNDAFQAVGATASASGYGTYTLSATGVWVYTLDNANAAVEALGNGDTLSDSFTVLSQDGTAQVVNITINGVDDRVMPTDIKLIIDSPLTDQNNMNNFSVTGTLVATDVDPGDFTYTLVSQTPTGGPAATFSISGDNLLSAGNLGQNQTYTLEIKATQSGDPVGMSYTEFFTIITGSNNNAGDTLSDPTGDDVLFGGDGNDFLIGGSGDDTLFGHASGSGAGDSLDGGAGNDTLYGGGGVDSLDGGTDNDILYGGGGVDAINTGTGNDVVVVNATVGAATPNDSIRVTVAGNGNDTGQDTITGFDLAADTLRILGTGVIGFVHGTDTAIGAAGGTNDGTVASFTALTGLVELNQATNNDWDDQGDVAVTFASPTGTFNEANFEARLQYDLTGTSGANTITGGALGDTLSGAGGIDNLSGAGGNDILIGGTGTDTLTGGIGNDTFKWTTTGDGVDSLADFTLGNLDPQNGALSANADVLDLSDVLGGNPTVVNAVNADNAATVDDYISFTVVGTTATLFADTDGLGGAAPVSLATFAVVSGTTASSLLNDILANNQLHV